MHTNNNRPGILTRLIGSLVMSFVLLMFLPAYVRAAGTLTLTEDRECNASDLAGYDRIELKEYILTVDGDFTTSATISGDNGGAVVVNGDMTTSAFLGVTSGFVIVDGNYTQTAGALYFSNDSIVVIGGDLTFKDEGCFQGFLANKAYVGGSFTYTSPETGYSAFDETEWYIEGDMIQGEGAGVYHFYYLRMLTPGSKITFTNGDVKTLELDGTKSQYAISPANCYTTLKENTYTGEVTGSPDYIEGFDCRWNYAGGKAYWYEGGYKQGTYNDPKGVLGDGTIRGREIYDLASDGWYWLDAVYDGAKAVEKEVWMPYIYQDEITWDEATLRQIAYESDAGMGDCVLNALLNRTGKWVRYDADGRMIKGWYTVTADQAHLYPDQVGNTYYYDHRTGLMAKGYVTLNGVEFHFDEITGVLCKDANAPDGFELQVLNLVNIEREKEGLAPLEWDGVNLGAGADVRAEEISRYFSHTRPDGSSWFTAITNPGYIGENIAAGYASPEEVVDGWMNSPGHRANILSPNFSKLGVGYYYAPGTSYTHYWVQLFSS